MYQNYYGLTKEPFGVTPDPSFLFLAPSHREALASLYCGIEAGRGFLGLIAPPGMGKTTLLFQLLERFKSRERTVFLFHTQCDSRDLVRYVLWDLGLETSGQDLLRLHGELNQFVTTEARAGRRLLLVIDEAQDLQPSVLETVRLLSNYETPSQKLIQIILSGQPQLDESLARTDLEQLRQRLSMIIRLQPFTLLETAAYIDHRLQVAGYRGGPLFTPEALGLIHEHSKGIPREINNLCFNALLLGTALQQKQIGYTILEEVIGDLGLVRAPGKALRLSADLAPTVSSAEVRQEIETELGQRTPDAPKDPPHSRQWGPGAWFAVVACVFLIAVGALLWRGRTNPISAVPPVQTEHPASPQGSTTPAGTTDSRELSAPKADASTSSPSDAESLPGITEETSKASIVPDALPPSDAASSRAEAARQSDTIGSMKPQATTQAPSRQEIRAKRLRIASLERLADADMDRGEYEEAIKACQAALALDPSDGSLRAKLEDARQAMATEKRVLQ